MAVHLLPPPPLQKLITMTSYLYLDIYSFVIICHFYCVVDASYKLKVKTVTVIAR